MGLNLSKRSIYGPKESNRYDKELFDIHNCLYRLLLTDSLNFNYWYVVLIKREKSNTCVKIGLQIKQIGFRRRLLDFCDISTSFYAVSCIPHIVLLSF